MLVSENTSKDADLSMGLKNQHDVLTTLRSKFGDSLVETQNKYCKWDYEDSLGNHYELKSRRIKKQSYSSTLLPCHKILQTNVKQYFIFHFLDQLTYIEYNEAVFNTFDTGWITDGRTNNIDLHFYIPVSELIDI